MVCKDIFIYFFGSYNSTLIKILGIAIKPAVLIHSSKIFSLCQIQEDRNWLPFVSVKAQANQLSATILNTFGCNFLVNDIIVEIFIVFDQTAYIELMLVSELE